MTQNLDRIEAPTRPAEPVAPRRWWRRPWIVPLFVVSVSYIAVTALPYLSRDTAPLMPHDGFPQYYNALLAHIGFATVALLTSILQVWPWLRRRYPVVHRWGGRLYMVTTVVAGLLGLVIVPFAPPAGKLGVAVATTLWLAFSIIGYVRIRQRRYAQHRRFMLYAFAMVMNNFWGTIIVTVGSLMPFTIDVNYLLEAARWVGWVTNLMLVQWWLNRTEGRPVR